MSYNIITAYRMLHEKNFLSIGSTYCQAWWDSLIKENHAT
jgi:hypothetical protein